jgi:hypothetical protein
MAAGALDEPDFDAVEAFLGKTVPEAVRAFHRSNELRFKTNVTFVDARSGREWFIFEFVPMRAKEVRDWGLVDDFLPITGDGCGNPTAST